jgi:hypothetical protein
MLGILGRVPGWVGLIATAAAYAPDSTFEDLGSGLKVYIYFGIMGNPAKITYTPPFGEEKPLDVPVTANAWKGLDPRAKFSDLLYFDRKELVRTLAGLHADLSELAPALAKLGISHVPRPDTVAGGKPDDPDKPRTPTFRDNEAPLDEEGALVGAMRNQRGVTDEQIAAALANLRARKRVAGTGPAGGIAGNEGARPIEGLAQSSPPSARLTSRELKSFVKDNYSHIVDTADRLKLDARNLEVHVLLYLPRIIQPNLPDLDTYKAEVERVGKMLAEMQSKHLSFAEPPPDFMLDPETGKVKLEYCELGKLTKDQAEIFQTKFHYLHSVRQDSES